MKTLVTVHEAASSMQLSAHTLWSMIRRGLLPPGVVVRFGRKIRIAEENLSKWLGEGGTARITHSEQEVANGE